MSTAGRPTWTPAMGSDPSKQGGFRAHVPSRQVSSKNAPGYSQLKVRQLGQNTSKELKERDLKRELQEKEKKHLKSKKDLEEDDQGNEEQEDEHQKPLLDDISQNSKSNISNEPKNIDADDTDSSDEDSSDSDDDDNDDDEEAELLKELERIKQEREEEAARKVEHEMEELAARAREQEAQILTGNPLLSSDQDFNIKKRWYDDTVFKNQAKGETKQQKRFINDTIRNDFHKKFLHKYVQ